MNQKKTILKYFTVLFVMTNLLSSCNDSKINKINNKELEQTENKKDSIELSKLVKNVYKFHLEKNIDDFPYKYENTLDTIFTGINWDSYKKNITVLKKTNYFTNDFLISHKNIAKTIDTSIKKAAIKWRNINDGIPLWSTGADDWCGCQDYQDDYWKLIILDSLEINTNSASFYWTWDSEHSHKYKMTAKKVENKWLIDSMEGFKHFGTIEDYDKMMTD